jgi:F-type H+-transporting ATPase subunit a
MAITLGLAALMLSPAVVGRLSAADEDPPTTGAEQHGNQPGQKAAPHGPAGKQEEPSAFEHVMDKVDHWPIFENKVFPLSIPLSWIKWIKEKKYGFPTKFMILELLVAVLMYVAFTGLARRIENGDPPHGPLWNFLEWMLTFTRDQIARPTIGEHDADKYLPFLWTLGGFVLFNNLFGMLPWMGSPTANIWVTGALALCSFVMMHGAPIAKMGPGHYVKSLWPHIDLPAMYGIGTVFGFLIKFMIFAIELIGTGIKSFVLAVRLFANMFAGHVVLATILLFIVLARNESFFAWGSISFISVAGVVALSLLELFVAFLQAYIFVFLTALFMGMGLHPQH